MQLSSARVSPRYPPPHFHKTCGSHTRALTLQPNTAETRHRVKNGEAGTNGERKKGRETHMHRLDHSGPIPLKKGNKRKKQSKTTVATCTSGAVGLLGHRTIPPSALAAGDLQAQIILGGSVYRHTSIPKAPCVRVAPFPIASDNS